MGAAPAGSAGEAPAGELTWRGLVLGAAIIVVFLAANLALGLRTGMTFATSIPAALISMGTLRALGGTSLLENNIVQTQASAAGTLCNVFLVLPSLVLVGAWSGFPFWPTCAVCALGGLLGVAYSVPLRRALVVRGDLPYPEGGAAAEVLRAGEARDGGAGLRELLGAAGVSGLIALATTGLRVLGEGVGVAFGAGSAVFRLGTGYSLALVGVGYLIGLGACLALLTGVLLAWGVAVPLLTALGHGAGVGAAGVGAGATPDALAQAVWADEVRLIGAGIIATGGAWTALRLMPAIGAGLREAWAGARTPRERLPREERDLPLPLVAGAALVLTLGVGGLLAWFVSGSPAAGAPGVAFVAGLTLAVAVFGFLMAAVCGYLAGLLGSSSSPISGIGILTTMAAAGGLAFVLEGDGGEAGRRFVLGLALLVAAVIVTSASIANDNLQDLKTGQLVGATPWRQQVALVVGVGLGSGLIAPCLGLLYHAYGFVGALPRPDMDPGAALPVPQAALIAQIARGIVEGGLPWRMVGIGAGLGLAAVGLEAALRRRGLRFPALSIGIGMYLPLGVEVTIALGGVLAWLSGRALRRRVEDPEGRGGGAVAATERRGVRLASGFLVGESLAGILLAGADSWAGRGGSLALVGPGFAPAATGLGALVFAATLGATYRLTSRPAEPVPEGSRVGEGGR